MTDAEKFESIRGQENVLALGEFLSRCSQIPDGFKEQLPQSLHAKQMVMDSVLTDWYYPGTREHKLYREVYRIMQLAKMSRTPANERLALQNTQDWLKNYKRKKWEPIPLYKKPVRTLSLFGSPGMGKTQFWDHAMNKCFKQVILQDNRLEVCFLVINCSAFKSMKALCQSIFREFDQALINYYNQHGLEYTNPYFLEFDKPSYTAEKMMPYIANIAHHHRLNVLILDEINHITDGNKEFDTIVNFFKNLCRAIGLPIIFSGTQDSFEKLSVNLQAIRRFGVITEWPFYKNETKAWDRFIKALWTFQITNNKADLTDEIKLAYYEKSGGIIDAAIQIHVKCQTEATEFNKTIDCNFIKKIADKYFPGLKKVVIGIHNNDPYIAQRYNDIQVGFPSLVSSLTDKMDFSEVTKKVAGMNLSKSQVSILFGVLKTQYPDIITETAMNIIADVAKDASKPQEEMDQKSNATAKLPKKSKEMSTANLPDVNMVEEDFRKKGISGDLNSSLLNS